MLKLATAPAFVLAPKYKQTKITQNRKKNCKKKQKQTQKPYKQKQLKTGKFYKSAEMKC